MSPARTVRARTAARALAVLGAAVVMGLAWVPHPSAQSPSAAQATPPVDLGPYALADTGLLGIPVAPPPPGNVRAVPHDRSALVTWDAARPNTSTVRSYRVHVDGVQRGPDVPASQRSTTVYGLTNYQQQQITVRTVDSDPRESGDSNGADVTPFDDAAPSPVTGLVATRGDGKVTLTWESESATESDRAGVRVYVDGSLRTSLPAATTSYVATGLGNDVEHTFHLVAFDARRDGYGPPGSVTPNASAPSATVRATPTDLTPPSAPTAFTAVRGDATAALTWTAPPENDVGLYKVVDDNGVLVASSTAPAASATATAMTNGRAYRLRIVAVDTHGNHSPASGEITVTPATPPIARTGLTAARGEGRVTLAWDPRVVDPARAAAAALRISVDGALVATLPGTATSYTATGLTDDRAYAFSVVGVDDQGRAGPAATAHATPTDLTPPSAPTALAAARGDTTADLSWTAPPEADVGTYLVLAQDGSTVATITAPATSRPLTGLANGTTYRLRLVAVDTHGNRSAPSNEVTVTPLAPPLAITGLAVAAKGSKATLRWSGPASAPDHEKAVQVQVWRAGPPDELLATVPASQRSYQWDGYAAGSAESFYVVAIDGDPRPSDPSATVSTVLAVPTGVTATVESQRTRIAWDPVVGASGYRVERLDGGGAVKVVGTTPDAFLDVTGLTNGTASTFRVLALAGRELSAPSEEVTVTPLDLPAVVQGLRAERRGSGVVLSWTAASSPAPGVAATTRVEVFRAGSPSTSLGTVDAPAATFTAADQTADPLPRFYAVALDAHGRASAVSATVTERLAAPVARGVPGDSTATISWTAVPGADRYRVEQGPDVEGGPWPAAVGTSGSGVSFTVTGLTNGTTYRFRVVALPASGQESPPSLVVAVTAGRAPAPSTPPGGGSAASGVAVTRDEHFALLETRTSTSDPRPALVLADLFAGTRTVIAQQPSGPSGDQTFRSGTRIAALALSEDGRQVAVATTVPVDPARDRNSAMDVYRYDTTAGAWTLVSAPRGGATGTATGVPGSLSTTDPTLRPQIAVSNTGDVFFTSSRTDLVTVKVTGVGVKGLNVFVQRVDGSIELASDAAVQPLQPSRVGGGPASFAVTPDGSKVVYVTGDLRAAGRDLVRHGVGTGVTTVLSLPADGDLNHRSGQIAVSDDGDRAAYSTLTGSTGSGAARVRLAALDPATGALSVTAVGSSAQSLSQVGIAPDGSAVFFATVETLVAPDDKGSVDVFRVLPDGTGLQRVTQPVPGPAVDAVRLGSYGPVRPLSADRVLVVTLSALVTGDGNDASDAYVVAPALGWARPVVGAP